MPYYENLDGSKCEGDLCDGSVMRASIVLIQKVDWQFEVRKLGWSRCIQVENVKGTPS